jgi:hypothetical protein
MAVGLIYGKGYGRLRAVVTGGDPVPLMGQGEAVLTIDDAQYAVAAGLAGLQQLVNAATRAAPSGDRAAMVDVAGSVVSVHQIDPGCGDMAFSGQSLVPNVMAEPGWVFAAGNLLRFATGARRRAFRGRLRGRMPAS